MKPPSIRRFTALLALCGAVFLSPLFAGEGEALTSRLPLIERPSAQPTNPVLAVMLTGDGGWAEIDRDIARVLNANGISVVGLNSPRYLETLHSPDELAADLQAIVAHYEQAWGKSAFVLIGFSRGADLLPFAVSRLPAESKSGLRLVSFLGLGRIADFKFSWLDLIHYEPRPSSVPVAPELEKLHGLKLLFLCGDADKDSIESATAACVGEVITMHGDHHLGGDFTLLGRIILGAIERKAPSLRAASLR